jgi:hypothetical protein
MGLDKAEETGMAQPWRQNHDFEGDLVILRACCGLPGEDLTSEDTTKRPRLLELTAWIIDMATRSRRGRR